MTETPSFSPLSMIASVRAGCLEMRIEKQKKAPEWEPVQRSEVRESAERLSETLDDIFASVGVTRASQRSNKYVLSCPQYKTNSTVRVGQNLT